MKATLLSCILFLTISASAQIIQVQSGASFSKMDLELNGRNAHFYDKTMTSPAVFLGLQYLDKKHFGLSANIGYIRKGGYEQYAYLDSSSNSIKGAHFLLDYISFNTVVEWKFPISAKISPFLSFGPRFDYLVHVNDEHTGIRQFPLDKWSLGLIAGAGVRYMAGRYQFSVRGDLLPGFTKIMTDGLETLYDKTFLVSASVGYRLK